MARVSCRCGETLKVRSTDPDRLVCPRCGARIRVRRSPTAPPGMGGGGAGDGYVRFNCPCGRRLKVRAQDRPEAGKCPDCGRIVPVPESAWLPMGAANIPGPGLPVRPGARTEDMDAADLARLEQWASGHGERPVAADPPQGLLTTTSHEALDAAAVKMEAGLRVCPRCGKPVHMSATVCRDCGAPVPKR